MNYKNKEDFLTLHSDGVVQGKKYFAPYTTNKKGEREYFVWMNKPSFHQKSFIYTKCQCGKITASTCGFAKHKCLKK